MCRTKQLYLLSVSGTPFIIFYLIRCLCKIHKLASVVPILYISKVHLDFLLKKMSLYKKIQDTKYP